METSWNISSDGLVHRKFQKNLNILKIPTETFWWLRTPTFRKHILTQKALQRDEMRITATLAILSWILRITAAVVLLQTLFFKFSAAPESVYIFTKVGAEPWGRVGSGIIELIAAVLLLTPRFTWLGSTIALGVMAGAILSHLTVLGIEVQGDKGLLFALALIVFVSSSINLLIHRAEIPLIGRRLA
jgi:putative oxidoreductase